jgi:hypothetical protein
MKFLELLDFIENRMTMRPISNVGAMLNIDRAV